MNAAPVLVLASRSPRRRELLASLGLRFVADAAPDDGPERGGSAAERVLGHARHKAAAVATRHPGLPVLAGDTLVFLGERCLPQPADRAQAEEMLRALAGRSHAVWTATVLQLPDGRVLERADRAMVRFRAIGDAELTAWLESDGWRGKAGAYGIQDAEVRWASLEEGALGTVVGLDAAAVRDLLEKAGLPSGPGCG